MYPIFYIRVVFNILNLSSSLLIRSLAHFDHICLISDSKRLMLYFNMKVIYCFLVVFGKKKQVINCSEMFGREQKRMLAEETFLPHSVRQP